MTTEITVFSMKKLPDGSATIAEKGEPVDFWDICVRDEKSNWIDGVEDLTRTEEVDENVTWLLEKYPGAELEYVW